MQDILESRNPIYHIFLWSLIFVESWTDLQIDCWLMLKFYEEKVKRVSHSTFQHLTAAVELHFMTSRLSEAEFSLFPQRSRDPQTTLIKVPQICFEQDYKNFQQRAVFLLFRTFTMQCWNGLFTASGP